jgi:hypothetical protein
VAVVRVNYVKKGKHERATAKANIKYNENRTGKDGAKMQRPLFTALGQITRLEAYEMIEGAEEGSTFFRVKISPDPQKEDAMKDLLLREITAQTADIEEKIGTPVTWVATIHDDHTPIRHIHVLLITKARLLPATHMIRTATEACVEQRKELDRVKEQAREREGDAWERER